MFVQIAAIARLERVLLDFFSQLFRIERTLVPVRIYYARTNCSPRKASRSRT
jgi:hypothetical protein